MASRILVASMSRHSVAEYLDDFLAWGDETAYVQPAGYRTERWSYRQVAETAFEFARELEARGIAQGDRVMLWGPNSAQWVAAFLGCALRGTIAVPMDDTATSDFSSRVARQVDAKLLAASSGHAGLIEIPTLHLEDLPRSPQKPSSAEIGPQDTLEIVFTSGTTAEPRGVVISHGNVLANIAPLEIEIRKYRKYERWFHPVRFLNLLPLSHVFGQFLGIFLPQLMGGTVVFENTLKPAEILATVKRERVSVIVSVPRVLQSLKEKIERDLEEDGRLPRFTKSFAVAAGKKFLRRAWIFRRIHRKFGFKFWAFHLWRRGAR